MRSNSMKAFEVNYSRAPAFNDTAVDVVFAKDEEEANAKFTNGKSLFSDYNAGLRNVIFKRIPFLDDCEKLTLMKKVEKLITEGSWCWTFGGDALAFYSPLTDKQLKKFEKMWIEEYGSELVCE